MKNTKANTNTNTNTNINGIGIDVEQTNWDRLLLPYRQAVSELTTKFQSLMNGFNNLSQNAPFETVEGRVKRISSILQKAKRKEILVSDIESVLEDIAGIRIICRFVEDIYDVVTLIKERNGLDLEIIKERDYVNNMKPSGYRSYHIIVKYPVITALGKKTIVCEIQIRTLAMNFWAVIEHSLKYKYNRQIPEEVQRRLIKSADAAFLLDNEVSKIRDDIVEAERGVLSRAKTIDDILTRIQALYKTANFEEVDALNQAFFMLYENGSEDDLGEFDLHVRAIASIYHIE